MITQNNIPAPNSWNIIAEKKNVLASSEMIQ